MKKYDQMNDFEMSVLSEIGNVGAGNAATALSHILSDRINMSVPDLRILDVSKMTTLLGGPENEFVGILVNMDKDVRGRKSMIFPSCLKWEDLPSWKSGIYWQAHM
jgi:chemotaxis protein CheC